MDLRRRSELEIEGLEILMGRDGMHTMCVVYHDENKYKWDFVCRGV